MKAKKIEWIFGSFKLSGIVSDYYVAYIIGQKNGKFRLENKYPSMNLVDINTINDCQQKAQKLLDKFVTEICEGE